MTASVPCNSGDPTGRFTEVAAIQYGPDPATNVLNLFTPTAAQLASLGLKQAAATLVIHGHGGKYSDGGFTNVCEQLAINGIACASIEYPQPDGATTFAWDEYASVNCALRWLRASGARYGYGATKIGVYGVSLGGLQAMWQVATQSMTVTPKLHQSVVESGCPNATTPAGVDAAVIQYGQSDLTLPGGPNSDGLLLGAANASNLAYQTEFSPITYLAAAIPQLVSVGDYDTTVNPANTGEWIQRLIALGAREIYVDPTNQSLCAIGAICGGGFSGLYQYWDLGGFGHAYEIFNAIPNGPNDLVIPAAYSCAVIGFYWKALLGTTSRN